MTGLQEPKGCPNFCILSVICSLLCRGGGDRDVLTGEPRGSQPFCCKILIFYNNNFVLYIFISRRSGMFEWSKYMFQRMRFRFDSLVGTGFLPLILMASGLWNKPGTITRTNPNIWLTIKLHNQLTTNHLYLNLDVWLAPGDYIV